MRLYGRRLICLLPLAATLLTGCRQAKMGWALLHRPSAHMPERRPVDVAFVNQGWTPQQRQWFYHAGQGAVLLPYKWFLAMEQPQLKLLGNAGSFADPGYLERFGFLPNGGAETPGSLPVGFARETIVDPSSGESVEVVGFTCAACHTGQLNYKGKGVRVDGGSAAADLASFQTELGVAVALTAKVPFRFDRFAHRVLGPDASADDIKKLRGQFDRFLAAGLMEATMAQNLDLYPTPEGFGRIDALARIGNFVFGNEIDPANLSVADAPVKLPPLWYTSWFAKVQYNDSIEQPMMRNIGEALGLRAPTDLSDPGKLYQSSVNVPNLWKMEDQLGGPTAFAGLKQPPWPAAVFGPIDQAKAQRGAVVYKQRCQGCHLPALTSPEIQDAQYWVPGLAGHRYLNLKFIKLDEIGTDPQQANDFASRTADTRALGLGRVPTADGLRAVTGKIRDIAYDKLKLTPAQRLEWDGYRADSVTAELGYKARPLGGIWATPPFLHNGSVPNLYELLLPAAQRTTTFYTGSREFDPVRVGYDTSKLKYGFVYKTTAIGNSNAGHEFSNTPGKGVLGPELSDDDRWAVIEYLKTLDDPSTSTAPKAHPTQPARSW